MKIPHSHTHPWPPPTPVNPAKSPVTPTRHPRESGDPGPRIHNRPTIITMKIPHSHTETWPTATHPSPPREAHPSSPPPPVIPTRKRGPRPRIHNPPTIITTKIPRFHGNDECMRGYDECVSRGCGRLPVQCDCSRSPAHEGAGKRLHQLPVSLDSQLAVPDDLPQLPAPEDHHGIGRRGTAESNIRLRLTADLKADPLSAPAPRQPTAPSVR